MYIELNMSDAGRQRVFVKDVAKNKIWQVVFHEVLENTRVKDVTFLFLSFVFFFAHSKK